MLFPKSSKYKLVMLMRRLLLNFLIKAYGIDLFHLPVWYKHLLFHCGVFGLGRFHRFPFPISHHVVLKVVFRGADGEWWCRTVFEVDEFPNLSVMELLSVQPLK